MIQARKLGHVVLKVRDAQKSKDFYMRALGLKLAWEDLDRGAVFLSFGEQFVSGFRNQGKYDDWWPKTYQPFFRFDRYDANKELPKDIVTIYTGGLNLFVAETTKFQVNFNWIDDQHLSKDQREILAQAQVGF